MGFLTNMINSGVSSGEIVIELPNQESKYPKGVQLVLDYHKNLGIESFGFYPECSVEQVFTQQQINELKQAICPKCFKLKWDNNRLIPIYRYHGISAVQVLTSGYSQESFPLQYAEYDHIDYIYFTEYNKAFNDVALQYALQKSKIEKTIESAIEKLNKDNPIYKESKIFSELVRNFFNYSNKTIGIPFAKLEDYLTLRTKVIAAHPELNY